MRVSVLFSEPKIPQWNTPSPTGPPPDSVSVLFSEPKIPQSQRERGSSALYSVSVLFSEPKIPQLNPTSPRFASVTGFSALQRAENSSMRSFAGLRLIFVCSFSALQRAENSSIPTLAPASIHISDRDDHASSFLSLPGASP